MKVTNNQIPFKASVGAYVLNLKLIGEKALNATTEATPRIKNELSEDFAVFITQEYKSTGYHDAKPTGKILVNVKRKGLLNFFFGKETNTIASEHTEEAVFKAAKRGINKLINRENAAKRLNESAKNLKTELNR